MAESLLLKMGCWRKSDGLVAQGYANFQKNGMDGHYTLPYIIMAIHTNFWKFEYTCATRYADFIRFSPRPHLKSNGLGN